MEKCCWYMVIQCDTPHLFKKNAVTTSISQVSHRNGKFIRRKMWLCPWPMANWCTSSALKSYLRTTVDYPMDLLLINLWIWKSHEKLNWSFPWLRHLHKCWEFSSIIHVNSWVIAHTVTGPNTQWNSLLDGYQAINLAHACTFSRRKGTWKAQIWDGDV